MARVSYAYDGEGRLCAVQSPSGYSGYVYNPEGSRVAKLSLSALSCPTSATGLNLTASYVLSLANEQMGELDPTGKWKHTNVFASGALLATYDQEGVHFDLGDEVGTKRVQASSTGSVEESCLSLPYGDSESCTTGASSDATEHHFTSKERDAESGLDYFGARYFGSSMGRFMSPDFADEEFGPQAIPYYNPSNPQSMNLYSYVRNNPLTHTDPDGHDVRVCDNNGQCNTVSNEAYTTAQQGNNGGLNVPTLDQVGSNGNGSGQFNSSSILDSSGNSVGSATYVSNGGADYYANANGFNQLANTSRVVKAGTVAYTAIYAGAFVGAGGLSLGGELTTLGDLSPNVQFTEHGLERLAERGITADKIQAAVDAAKKSGDVIAKVGRYGTKQLEYTGNGLKVFVEQEGANAGKVITAYFH